MDLGSESLSIVALPPAVLHLSSSRIVISKPLVGLWAALGRGRAHESFAVHSPAVSAALAILPAREESRDIGRAPRPGCSFLCPGGTSLDNAQLLRNRGTLFCQIKFGRRVLAGE